MDEFGGLTGLDVALYRRVLAEPGRTVPDCAADLNSTSDEIDKAVAHLAELGPLGRVPTIRCAW